MAMMSRKKAKRVLWYENIGFILIIVLSWVDEILNLPQLLFGGVEHSNWRESAMETLLILVVWLVIYNLSRRVLARLFYLEGFLRVCSWCRKINHEDRWIPLEEYFASGYNTQISHGICPDCLDKFSKGTP